MSRKKMDKTNLLTIFKREWPQKQTWNKEWGVKVVNAHFVNTCQALGFDDWEVKPYPEANMWMFKVRKLTLEQTFAITEEYIAECKNINYYIEQKLCDIKVAFERKLGLVPSKIPPTLVNLQELW